MERSSSQLRDLFASHLVPGVSSRGTMRPVTSLKCARVIQRRSSWVRFAPPFLLCCTSLVAEIEALCVANPYLDMEGLLADAGDASVLVHDGGRVTWSCLPQLLGFWCKNHACQQIHPVFLCHATAYNVDQGHVFHCVAFDQRNPLRTWIVRRSLSSGHCKRHRASLHDSVEPVVASDMFSLPIPLPAKKHVQAKAAVDHVADWLEATSTIKDMKLATCRRTRMGESFGWHCR